MVKAYKGTPTVDGKVDEMWKDVPRLLTSRSVEEHDGLTGDQKPSMAWVKCMWDDGHLYCLAEVSDDKISTEGLEAWERDSVEFFVDGNLARSGSYDSDDAQYRTDASGETSCGANNDLANYKSAVTKTETGYIVEACIKLETAVGKKIGFDAQVNNDPGTGSRQSTMKWNDSSNETYLDVSLIGTLEMVDGK